jgi:hypothetical protein
MLHNKRLIKEEGKDLKMWKTAKLATQKMELRKEHVNVGYDSLAAEVACNTV